MSRAYNPFLGLTNNYRRFIDKYSEIAEPLYQLTKKGVTFNWGTEQQKTFDVLKEKLVSPRVLAYPLSNHWNPSSDVSDPDPCSGGYSVPKQVKETETVCKITRINESDDEEEEVCPHISLNAYNNEELGQKQRDDPELCMIFKWIQQGFPTI